MCSSVSLSLCTYICQGTTFLGQAVCVCMFRDLCPANQYLPKPKFSAVFCVQVSRSTKYSRGGIFFLQICCIFARSPSLLGQIQSQLIYRLVILWTGQCCPIQMVKDFSHQVSKTFHIRKWMYFAILTFII